MPPRIPALSCLRASTSPSVSAQFTLPIRTFVSTSRFQAESIERQKKRLASDPYIVAQRNRKKAANLSRRAELEQARVASLGNPVRGVSTPFVESFDTGKPIAHEEGKKIPQDRTHLNYAFDPATVEQQLKRSQKLAVPLSGIAKQATPGPYPWNDGSRYDQTRAIEKSVQEIQEQNEKDHARAVEAIRRITALENGSSKDRMRVNIARCVETFGRHNTDKIFPPKAPSLNRSGVEETRAVRPETNIAAAAKRVGPDTGSSEVQIAILTAKIKTLADFLQTRGKGDKHNKRNLRLLVHRRQKLLQYLRRKERGGPRWQHCIETLGLTEATNPATYFGSSHDTTKLPDARDADEHMKESGGEGESLLAAIIVLPNSAEKKAEIAERKKARLAAGQNASADEEDELGVPVGQINSAPTTIHQQCHRTMDFAIDILPEYQGRGYGSEAINWALDLGFRRAGLHSIRLKAFGWNTGAIRLYERLGFVMEGRERDAVWYEGQWYDTVTMGMLEDEWRARQAASGGK
ncbi:hypothetical protein yc1106_06257 [Curvularia clavata]|uniref:N-acetyltransferase domain-containing protein n=1 Tax=Curvularia clavata TaxID=95742 RepID=A0A9Q9DSS8_CURCL|nr:hypothetical protein yc1106_06257 [Curvularia clavata]